MEHGKDVVTICIRQQRYPPWATHTKSELGCFLFHSCFDFDLIDFSDPVIGMDGFLSKGRDGFEDLIGESANVQNIFTLFSLS